MRLIEYDYVRVTAMMFVIFLHVLFFVDFSEEGGAYVIIDNTLKTLFFSCNALFFMLSGKFAVRLKKNYRQYLYKKIITLGIPILICFVFRTYISGGGGMLKIYYLDFQGLIIGFYMFYLEMC